MKKVFGKSQSGIFPEVIVEQLQSGDVYIYHTGEKDMHVKICKKDLASFGIGKWTKVRDLMYIEYTGGIILEKFEDDSYGLDNPKGSGYVSFGEDYEKVFEYVRSLA